MVQNQRNYQHVSLKMNQEILTKDITQIVNQSIIFGKFPES